LGKAKKVGVEKKDLGCRAERPSRGGREAWGRGGKVGFLEEVFIAALLVEQAWV